MQAFSNRLIGNFSRGRYVALLAVLAVLAAASTSKSDEVVRVGVVGCDTSHAVAFTRLMNDPNATGDLAKVRVVAAYPGGSDDIPSSYERLDRFVAELRDEGIEIVDSLDQLVTKCDAFLLESVDGRVHLQQFRKIAVGRPVFIDKPAAASLTDLLAMFAIAEQTSTPCFSSSVLRYCGEVQKLADDVAPENMLGVSTASPYQLEPHHPDLFWYGIHGVEALYALMGTGCAQVSRTETAKGCLVVGKWHDGRIGVYRGLKDGPGGRDAYSFTVYARDAVRHRSGFDGYAPLVNQIARFVVSGEVPVTHDETIEMFAFMEAADVSKRSGGAPVQLGQVLQQARSGGSAAVDLQGAGKKSGE